MALTTAKDIYEAIKALPANERLRLVETIAHDFTEQAPSVRPSWMEIEGIAPDLLSGEDAQAWISRTRREGDENREIGLRSKR